MKAVAYVSDENYLALAGVLAELESLETGQVAVLESSPRGAFYGDFPAGRTWTHVSGRRHKAQL